MSNIGKLFVGGMKFKSIKFELILSPIVSVAKQSVWVHGKFKRLPHRCDPEDDSINN